MFRRFVVARLAAAALGFFDQGGSEIARSRRPSLSGWPASASLHRDHQARTTSAKPSREGERPTDKFRQLSSGVRRIERNGVNTLNCCRHCRDRGRPATAEHFDHTARAGVVRGNRDVVARRRVGHGGELIATEDGKIGDTEFYHERCATHAPRWRIAAESRGPAEDGQFSTVPWRRRRRLGRSIER